MNLKNYINNSKYRATGGNRALLNDYHRRSDSLAQWQINFLPDTATQIYGFDYLGSGYHGIFSGSEYYPYLSGNYDLRYKSVECGKTDKVIVDFGSYPERDSVVFKDKWGVTLKLSKGNVLNFTGVAKPDTNYIYAYRGDEKIGKLSVNTYKKKSYKVVLVSVNGAKLPDISSLQDSLNKFYKHCVASFEVDTDTLNIKDLFPFSHGDKNRFSGLNDDQKRVLKAYDSRIKPDINYLFFIPDGAETNGVAGYNPLGYNFGFIYYGAGNRTIAHELAHGIASLNHPFKDDVENKGQTDNLLDYNDGTSLWHFQWDKLQNPPNRIFKWNFEEEDAEDIVDTIFYLKVVENNTKYPVDKSIEIESYLGKNYEFQLVKADSVYSCDWKFQDNIINNTNSFQLDISLPKNDTLFVSINDSILAKYCITITQFNDYKIKIEELDNYLSCNDSLLLSTEPDSLIHVAFMRGDDQIQCTWHFNSINSQEVLSYSLPIDKAINDTLRVYWKDTLLLVSLKVEIKDLPYIFKIKDTKIQAVSGSEMYVVQQNRKLDLQLFRGEHEVNATWKGLKVSNQSFVSLDFSKTDNKKIQVVDAQNKVLASLSLLIYSKPKVAISLPDDYDGRFGFDNFYDDYPDIYPWDYLNVRRDIPIVTMHPFQNMVNLKLEIKVASEFLCDTNASITIRSTDSCLNAVSDKYGKNINYKNLVQKNSISQLELSSTGVLPKHQYIFICDNSNDTIAKIAIFCRNYNTDKNLYIYELSDTIKSFSSFKYDLNKFLNNSYNQALVKFNISYQKLVFPNDILKKISVSSNNRKEIANYIDSLFMNDSINPRNLNDTKSNDYYLFLVPFDYFSDINAPNFEFYGFGNEISLNPLKFSHAAYISKKGLNEQIGIHEVGHTFGLRHIFTSPYNLPQGSTENYMDYSYPKMKSFWRFQWLSINLELNQ